MNVQFRKNVQQAFDYSDRHYTLIEIVPQVATRHIIQHLSAERILAAAISISATFCFPHNISFMIKLIKLHRNLILVNI